MSERLTRKEIKRQDTFQATVGRGLEMVQAYRRQIIFVAGLLAAIVVALVGWFLYVQSVEDDAQALLAEAMEVQAAPVVEGDEAPEELTFASAEARRAKARELFTRVVDEYGATGAADVARVFLGEIAAVEGDAERAAELWSEFLDEHPEHMLGAQVRLNLYALDRAAGRGEEVVAELEAMVDAEDPALPQDVALYELAITLEELGREEEAAARYQRLVDEFGQSPYALEARQKTAGAGGAAAFPGLPS